MIPTNTSVGFRVADAVYGVDEASLEVSVSGETVIAGGSLQKGGAVDRRNVRGGIQVECLPAVPFDTTQTVVVEIACRDRAHPPNTLSYSFSFETGCGCIVDNVIVEVSPAGCVIEDSSGVCLTIPAHAVEDTTTIQVGRLENAPALPDSLSGVGLPYRFAPDGQTFRFPILITLPLPEEELLAGGVLTPETLCIYWFSTQTGAWEKIPVWDIDLEAGTVTFQTDHFSYFQIANWTPAFAPFDFDDFASAYNYPNPFNPDETETVICYRLRDAGTVTTTIFDVAGNRVAVLEEDALRPALAPCRCIWDGRNSRGETAANNIYFCVIESEGRRLIRKIALIR